MSDEIAPDVTDTPIRSDDPEINGAPTTTVANSAQSFDTIADVSCTITATPGKEGDADGYFMYFPYRAFFLDKETAKKIAEYFAR